MFHAPGAGGVSSSRQRRGRGSVGVHEGKHDRRAWAVLGLLDRLVGLVSGQSPPMREYPHVTRGGTSFRIAGESDNFSRMKRRRTLAALLALLAYSASVAEQVWASTCAPVEARPVAAAPIPSMEMDGHGAAPAGCGEEERLPSSEHSPAPAGADDCPFQALSATGCQVVVLPAFCDSPPLARSASGGPGPVAAATPDLVFADPPFHPPQA